jgi:hypothetical protein
MECRGPLLGLDICHADGCVDFFDLSLLKCASASGVPVVPQWGESGNARRSRRRSEQEAFAAVFTIAYTGQIVVARFATQHFHGIFSVPANVEHGCLCDLEASSESSSGPNSGT